jgi:hypothetical protein
MYLFAIQTLAIGCDLLNAVHAKAPKKIQHVVWPNAHVHPIHYTHIHLFRGRERTIASANDIEAPKVKVGREPSISHILIMK